MKGISLRAIMLFFISIAAGYGAMVVIVAVILGHDPREYNFGTLTLLALVIGALLMVIFRTLFELDLTELTGTQRGVEYEFTETGELVPKQPRQPLFPYEEPSEHWDIDFGDSKQTYQGAELPIWLLAGWAIFILWAIIYLMSGLPSAL
jgi:hypothetical protein